MSERRKLAEATLNTLYAGTPAARLVQRDMTTLAEALIEAEDENLRLREALEFAPCDGAPEWNCPGKDKCYRCSALYGTEPA
jgi:hypothetical protein